MNDETIEQEIQRKGLDKAPRVTPQDVEANIKSIHYFTAADGLFSTVGVNGSIPPGMDRVTFCLIELQNGTKVTGINYGSVSMQNFDAQLGRRMAHQDAVDQIWPLMGYALAEKLAAANS